MTTTVLVNGATVSSGYGQNATKTSFQTSTTGYSIAVTVVAGAVADPGKQIRCYVASSPVSIATAAIAAKQLASSAAIIDVTPVRGEPSTANTTTQNFPLLARLGDYLYCWLEVPNFNASTVVTVTLWENA